MKKTILAIIGVAFIAFGCNKKKLNDLTNEGNPSKIALIAQPSNSPSVQNGILDFNSEVILTEYLDYLTSITSVSETSNDSIDVDEILDEVETNYDYLSYRKSFSDRIENGNFTDVNSIPMPRFHSRNFQSVLNSQLEVIVNNVYYNFSNPNWTVSSTNLSTTTISAIRSYLTSGAECEKIEDVIAHNGQCDFGDIDITPDGPLMKKDAGAIGNSNDKYKLYVRKVLIGSSCQSNEVTLTKIGLYGFGANPNLNLFCEAYSLRSVMLLRFATRQYG